LQLFYQRFNVQDYLLFSLLGITSVVLLANFVSPETAQQTTNLVAIILSSVVMFFSLLMVSQYGLKGNHGKAWILFMLFAAYWFCAESVDVMYNVILGVEPWEYADDFFYIVGYQLFFASLIFYLKPFTKQISKKLLIGASITSISLLIPSLMMILNSEPESIKENFFILLSYPILDSIILIPGLVGVVLFFRGGVNFMISLLCLGIISQIIGDNSVLFLSLQNSYYQGHLAEVLFLWTYTMFAFGISNQIGLFRQESNNSSCPACGKTCSGHS